MLRGGFFTTLLVVIPLITIPLVAVFGVPQFRPVAEQQMTAPPHAPVTVELGGGQSSCFVPADLFAPLDDPTDTQPAPVPSGTTPGLNSDPWLNPTASAPVETTPVVLSHANPPATTVPTQPEVAEPVLDLFATPLAAAEKPETAELSDAPLWALDAPVAENRPAAQTVPHRPSPPITDFEPFALEDGPAKAPATPSEPVAEAKNTLEPFGWQTAVARLNELGIREYHLSPAAQPDRFHFSCHYTPAGNSRLSRMFEAEADQPLIAVRKVLSQIEEWTALR